MTGIRIGSLAGLLCSLLAVAPLAPPHCGKKKGPSLQSLGPVAIAGRVRALAVRPDGTLWAASPSGGLWSRDSTGIWRQADDYFQNLAFASLAIDPQAPDVMYAGTGEIFTFFKEGSWLKAKRRGAGIFKTTNAAQYVSASGELRARLTWSGAVSSRVDTAEWTINRR